MRRIVLSTESVADLPKSFVEQYAIQIIPMHVIMDGRHYLENTLAVEEVFDFYSRTKKIPSTTATNVQEYEQYFSGIRRAFPESVIIHLGYTSRSSASFHCAELAAKDFEGLYLIDTLNVTGGLAAIVMYAATLLEKEPCINHLEFIQKIKLIALKTRLAFIPATLEFLRAGGRVSNIAFIGGSLLKLKPCIEMKEGKLVPTRKYRGKMSYVAERLLRDYIAKYDINRKQLNLIYSHGLTESIKRKMADIAQEVGFENVTWIQVGPTISVHAGPGCFGVAGIEN